MLLLRERATRTVSQLADGNRVAPLVIFVPHASDGLTDHLAHGDGLVAFEIVSRLARRGHTVHVASPRIDVRRRIPDTLRLYEIALPNPASLRERLRYMRQVRRLFRQVRRESVVDVVHQLNPVLTGISLATLGGGAPVVLGSYIRNWPAEFDCHTSFQGWRGGVTRRAQRWVISLQQKHAAAILVTTPAARSHCLSNIRRDGKKTVLLPHGIDPSLYTPALSAVESTAPSILFLGGIEDRKGVFVLLDAFRRVHARLPRCRLVIAGSGVKDDVLRDMVARMDEKASIEILGRVERSDVPALMERCTVFCMPSFGEPFGMSLLEAMACAKPAVITDAGGAAHIIDELGGRKVPVGDEAALADALVEIISSPTLQAAMGRHNRELIERRYDWERVIDRLECEYRSLVRRAPTSNRFDGSSRR